MKHDRLKQLQAQLDIDQRRRRLLAGGALLGGAFVLPGALRGAHARRR
jgi:hypothetical protein